MVQTANDLNISQPGVVCFDGTSIFTGRTLTAGPGISITNGTGISGDPVITANITADLHTAKFIVGDLNNGANYSTISSALTAASSGDTIYIQTGSYTENLTLKAGVNITTFTGDSSQSKFSTTANVRIIGKLTATFDGTCNISNIFLQTNADYILEITGSSATRIIMTNCFINALDFSAFHSTSSGSRLITLINCFGSLNTTGVAYFVMNPGNVSIFGGEFANQSLSSTASTFVDSVFQIVNSTFLNILDFSGTSTFGTRSVTIGVLGQVNVTLSGTSTANIRQTSITSGTATAVVVGAGCGVFLYSSEVSSSNAAAMSGAGSLTYSDVIFTSSSSAITVTTQVPLPLDIFQGGTNLSSYATGDTLYASATNVLSKRTIGSTGDIYTVAGGVPTWATPASGGVPWTDVTGTSATMAKSNGYQANNAGLVTLTMPSVASSTFGDTIKVGGFGAGGWLVQCVATQIIHMGSSATSAAGSLASTNRYDQLELVCSSTTNEWFVRNAQGNITVA